MRPLSYDAVEHGDWGSVLATQDLVRTVALELPDVSVRRAASGNATELVTNGKSFVVLPDDDPAIAHAVTSDDNLASLVALAPRTFARAEAMRGRWVEVRLPSAGRDKVHRFVVEAWRLRSQKRSQYAYLGPKFFADIEPMLSKLRAWPELSETGTGHFSLNKKPFMHFHYGWTTRYADAKIGEKWGPPIPVPFGRPPRPVVTSFLAEIRRRVDLTL
jgi:hypothetical protein